MLTSKTIWTLLGITVLVVGAAVINRQSEQRTAITDDGLYFPDLLERSNQVAKAIIKDSDSTLTIERRDGQWIITEKGGYPAATTKVRELILGLARLKRIEPKTKNTDLYAKLDLNDIAEPGSKSRLLQLMDSSGQNLVVMVLGKNKMGGAERDQFYVRTPGNPQAWLVEGFLPAVDDVTSWMETTLIAAEEVGEVRAVTVERSDESLIVVRDDIENPDFHLQGLGPDDEIESQYAINQIAQGFKGLRMEDVRPGSMPLDGSESAEATLESFDGMRLKLTLYQQNDQNFARLQAEYEAEAEVEEALRKKAQTWNEFWGQWVYVLPDYQVESIFVERADLLKPNQEQKVE